jgi:hypothetical protein
MGTVALCEAGADIPGLHLSSRKFLIFVGGCWPGGGLSYYRFPLSFREVEEMMLQRGIVVSHETVVRHEAPGNRVEVGDLRRRSVAAVR